MNQHCALIIDDSFITRRLLGVTLEKMGFAIVEATDGNEALAKIEEIGIQKISLIITDFMMPKMSGLELIQQINGSYSELPPIIVCSGKSDAQTIKKLGIAGVKNYMLKPIDAKLLINKVEELFIEA
jgi:CheY-like chemotaxis protein